MNKIKNFQKKNEQMAFTAILRTFIHSDKETLADVSSECIICLHYQIFLEKY